MVEESTWHKWAIWLMITDTVFTLRIQTDRPKHTAQTQTRLQNVEPDQGLYCTSQKHAYIILTPLNPTFI